MLVKLEKYAASAGGWGRLLLAEMRKRNEEVCWQLQDSNDVRIEKRAIYPCIASIYSIYYSFLIYKPAC
jgi:hypothetical protein